jgi:RsiW-degrading membrane proteinase PrsW (M82 family)
MSITLVISAFGIPLLFWIAYHYYHDRHRPEPVTNLIVALLLGVCASWLAGWGYDLTAHLGLRPDITKLTESNLPGLMLYCIVGIGLLEELAKLLPFALIVMRFRDFDEPLDGIVYASFIGLGFALTENVNFAGHLSLLEAIARGFASPVVHIVFASVWGYHLALAHLAGSGIFRTSVIWLSAAALLHGIYDYVVLAYADVALLVAATIITALWLWRLKVIVALNTLDADQRACAPLVRSRGF